MSIVQDNYGMIEEVFEAVDVIIGRRVSGLPYDTTIICEVTNAKWSFEGRYTVTDGSSEYDVYSEVQDYKEGDLVYVAIPNGDMDAQKLIIGRYVDKDGQPYLYVSPLDNFVDATTNIITKEEAALEFGLTANGEPSYHKQLIYSLDCPDIAAYDVLAFKANFKTLLKDYNLIDGSYGIEINVMDGNTVVKNFIFDSDSMAGDVYNFSSYYPQEVLFDISQVTKADRIKIYFYENQDFRDSAGLIQGTFKVGNDIIEDQHNIFAKDFYIAFGYDILNYYQDTVELYCSDLEFSSDTKNPEKNTKRINLRWIHKDEEYDKMVVINKVNDSATDETEKRTSLPENAVVHYYHYNMDLDPEEPDELAGTFWEPAIMNGIEIKREQYFNFVFKPDVTKNSERIKVIIEYPSVASMEAALAADEDYKTLMALTSSSTPQQKRDAVVKVDPSKRDEDIDEAIEELKTQIEENYLGRVQYYESNELVFLNQIRQKEAYEFDIIHNVVLTCDTVGQNGVYMIYGPDGNITQHSESTKIRQFEVSYNKIKINNDDEPEKIRWYIPAENTMINSLLNDGETATSVEKNGRKYFMIQREGFAFTEYTDPATGVTREAKTGDISPTLSETFSFTIKDYYNPNSSNNNTVIVEIEQEKSEYIATASIDLLFGTSGSNGTEYTFLLKASDFCFVKGQNNSITITPHVYDYNQQQLDASGITYYMYNNQAENEEVEDPETLNQRGFYSRLNKSLGTNGEVSLTLNDFGGAMNGWKYTLIKATVNVNNSVKLDTYLTIPIRDANTTITSYDGAISIFYDSAGANPVYYKGEHKLYNSGSEIEGLAWEVWFEDQTGKTSWTDSTWKQNAQKFYPQFLTGENELIPTSTFFSNSEKSKVSIIAKKNNQVIWFCPIYIGQNVFTNAMLNAWNGELTIDEKNGIILSTMMGAGRKTLDNKYEGVILGEDTYTDEKGHSRKNFGLYGYEEGVQSFGFMNTGEAFIGKSGSGRILFDGNESTITSSNYVLNGSGVKIDLDDGSINLANSQVDENGNKEGVSITLNTNAAPYFNISKYEKNINGESEKKELINVSNDEYYFQTIDFNKNERRGLRFLLSDGRGNSGIEAYGNFLLNAVATKPIYYESSDGGTKNYYISKEQLADIKNAGIVLNEKASNVTNGKVTVSEIDTYAALLSNAGKGPYVVKDMDKDELTTDQLQNIYPYETLEAVLGNPTTLRGSSGRVNFYVANTQDMADLTSGFSSFYTQNGNVYSIPMTETTTTSTIAKYSVPGFTISVPGYTKPVSSFQITQTITTNTLTINNSNSVKAGTASDLSCSALYDSDGNPQSLATISRSSLPSGIINQLREEEVENELAQRDQMKRQACILSYEESDYEEIVPITDNQKISYKIEKSIDSDGKYTFKIYSSGAVTLQRRKGTRTFDSSTSSRTLYCYFETQFEDASEATTLYLNPSDIQYCTNVVKNSYSILKTLSFGEGLNNYAYGNFVETSFSYITIRDMSKDEIVGQIILKADEDVYPLRIIEGDGNNGGLTFGLNWNGDVYANSFNFFKGKTKITPYSFLLEQNASINNINFDYALSPKSLNADLIYFGMDGNGKIGASILNTIIINKNNTTHSSATDMIENIYSKTRLLLASGDVGVEHSLAVKKWLAVFGKIYAHGGITVDGEVVTIKNGLTVKGSDLLVDGNGTLRVNGAVEFNGSMSNGVFDIGGKSSFWFHGKCNNGQNKSLLRIGWVVNDKNEIINITKPDGTLLKSDGKQHYNYGMYNMTFGSDWNVTRRHVKMYDEDDKKERHYYVLVLRKNKKPYYYHSKNGTSTL